MLKQTAIVLVVFCTLFIMIAAILPGCGSSVTAIPGSQTASSTQPTASTPATTTVATAIDKSSEPSTPAAASSGSPGIKTEVIYFHMNARCVTCLCFEKQIKLVIGTYYADAIRDGKMTFSILNAQEKQNEAIAKKYKVVGSSFFINTILNGIDHIKDIQAIWDWNCRNDADGFNQKVKIVIARSLNGEF